MRSLSLALMLLAAPAFAAPTVSSALARGLGTRGIIGPHQARVAEKRVSLLPTADRTVVHDLVNRAGSNEEAAFLLKAVAAGHEPAEVSTLADTIRGKPVRWLQRNLTAGDTLQSMTGTRQTASMSCQSSVAITVVTESDPIYALKLHKQNPRMNDPRVSDKLLFNTNLGHRERKMLESASPWGDRGVAVPRGAKGGVGRTPLDLLNRYSQITKLRYEWIPQGDEASGTGRSTRHLIAQMTRALEDGQMVSLRGTGGGAQHIMLAMHTRIDRDAGVPVRMFQIHDPQNGNTSWVSQREILAGRLSNYYDMKLTGIHAPKPLD